MNTNMGTVDRGVRAVIAIYIVVLYFSPMISGTIAVILAVVGVIFTVTSVVGTCPAYLPFGLNMKKEYAAV